MQRTMSRVLCGLLVGVTSCGGSNPTEPINPLGAPGTTYVLTRYDGGGLPALVSPSLGLCGGQIVGGSLAAVRSSEASVSIAISAPCSAGNPVTTSSTQGVLTTAASGALVLTFVQQGYADTISLSGVTASVRDRGHTYVFTAGPLLD